MKIEYNSDSYNLAAIDIGSNAARLLIKSVTRQDDGTLLFQKQQFVRFPLRLGLDVFQGNKISKEREEQFVRMMKAFRQLMIIYNVADFRACATSALRDASNGNKVLHRIKERTGIKIEIISGDEEARIIYDNHIERMLLSSVKSTGVDKTFLYIDVGGGSTEISIIANGQLVASKSFNIGTLRLLSGTVPEDAISSMCEEIQQMMTGCPGEVTIIGSGGNINKLYRLVPKKSKLKDRISMSQLERLFGQLSALSVEERMREFDLRADRADVIVPAAQIFIAIAQAVGVSEITVPTVGLADGIINELSEKIEQVEEPQV